jgi:hypothetical protein
MGSRGLEARQKDHLMPANEAESAGLLDAYLTAQTG